MEQVLEEQVVKVPHLVCLAGQNSSTPQPPVPGVQGSYLHQDPRTLERIRSSWYEQDRQGVAIIGI